MRLSRTKVAARLLHPSAIVVVGIACSAAPRTNVSYETYDTADFALILKLDEQNVPPGEELQASQTLTNTAASSREGFVHFPRLLRLRNTSTEQEWLVRDTSTHDVCAAANHFVLERGEQLSWSVTIRIPELPDGEYAVAAEVTVAACDFGGATPHFRWTITSSPVTLRVSAPPASTRPANAAAPSIRGSTPSTARETSRPWAPARSPTIRADTCLASTCCR
jgi:hypothetical protein